MSRLSRLTAAEIKYITAIRSFFIICLLGNLLWIASVCFSAPGDWAVSFRLLGICGLLSGVSIVVGGFFGFLFGVPRVLSASAQKDGAEKPADGRLKGIPVTNLEQISDWLTKILVGAGLTQLHALPDLVKDWGGHLAPALKPLEQGGTVGLAIIGVFGMIGFLWFHFETRTSLMEIFKQDESPAVSDA